jgi:hypothetical protein
LQYVTDFDFHTWTYSIKMPAFNLSPGIFNKTWAFQAPCSVRIGIQIAEPTNHKLIGQDFNFYLVHVRLKNVG